MKLKIKESDIKRAIKDYLNILQAQGKLLHYPLLAGMGSYPGLPDRQILLPGGIIIHLEVKRPLGKLSEHQKAFREWCAKLGHIYLVVFGVQDLITNLNDIQNPKGLWRGGKGAKRS